MFCRKCGNEVQDDWVACPKCGDHFISIPQTTATQSAAKKTFNGMKIVFQIFLLLLFFYAVTSIEAAWSDTKKAAEIMKNSEQTGLSLLSHKSENGYTVGEVRNDSKKTYITASVRVKYYDEKGNVIKDGVDIVSHLNPGETWKFKVFEPKEPGKYTIEEPKGRWKNN